MHNSKAIIQSNAQEKPMDDIPCAQLEPLLKRIASADQEAFITLFRHYKDRVRKQIRRQRIYEPADVNEILSDVFMAVYKDPCKYRCIEPYSHWLSTVTGNKIKDWIRRRVRTQKYEAPFEDEVVRALPDPSGGPHEIVVHQLTKEVQASALEHCLKKLSPSQYELLHRVYIESQDQQTAAHEIGIPVGTVKSRLFNAKQKLTDCVNRRTREVGYV